MTKRDVSVSSSSTLPTASGPARPEEYDDATRAALNHIDRHAVRVVADGRPERTRTGYAQDWVSWTMFCTESGVPLLAVTPGTLAAYVEWLWTRPGWKDGTHLAPSTIDRRISGTVVSARQEHGVKPEKGVARLARNRLAQLVKEMEKPGEKRGRGQAAPLLVDHLVTTSAACPDNLRGIRDRALVFMHFAVAGREHELAATGCATTPTHPSVSRPTCASPKSARGWSQSPTAPAPPSGPSGHGPYGRRQPTSPTLTAPRGAASTPAGTPS
ncbi:hypothetical protein ACIO8G_34690 [Streptomyces sp. NPDC087219]|uniref:hypothetical protein n=1 Tax=Streptomyces sp. NPDC087219 TaxID=3365770 RepID=UPI003818CA84